MNLPSSLHTLCVYRYLVYNHLNGPDKLTFIKVDSTDEYLLAERGITVCYEAIRLWCNKFDAEYAKLLKRIRRGFGDTYFIDEVFIKINGIQHYLWRAVDQDGDVIDVFLQERIDSKAA